MSIARRDRRLILNLVDADNVDYIPAEIIDAALEEIQRNIHTSDVLVHCNQGRSRSPTIALLYLAKFTSVFTGQDHNEAVLNFRALYPLYSPARGMAEYAERNWSRYSTAA